MALILVANENLTLSHNAASATLQITNSASTKNKAEGAGIYFEKISVSVTNATVPGIDQGDGQGSGDILPTSTKVKEGANLVIREGDQVTINLTGTNTNPAPPPATVTGAGTITVTVQSAGQSTVKAQ